MVLLGIYQRFKGHFLNELPVSFKSAFVIIWGEALWKMIRTTDISNKIVNFIEKLHSRTICSVMTDGYLARFQVAVGVRQGCLLYPTLFNLFLDFVIQKG